MSETTPETSDLRDRLAKALDGHAYTYPDWFCECGDYLSGSWAEWRDHTADALLSLVAQEIAAAYRVETAALAEPAPEKQSIEDLRVALTSPTQPPEAAECCASGRCEVCTPGYVWGRDG